MQTVTESLDPGSRSRPPMRARPSAGDTTWCKCLAHLIWLSHDTRAEGVAGTASRRRLDERLVVTRRPRQLDVVRRRLDRTSRSGLARRHGQGPPGTSRCARSSRALLRCWSTSTPPRPRSRPRTRRTRVDARAATHRARPAQCVALTRCHAAIGSRSQRPRARRDHPTSVLHHPGERLGGWSPKISAPSPAAFTIGRSRPGVVFGQPSRPPGPTRSGPATRRVLEPGVRRRGGQARSVGQVLRDA
jgi:hypothetical protein